MKKLETTLVKQCLELRQKGYSLSEISLFTKVPKTTLYSYVKDIQLSFEQINKIETRRKEKNKNKINPRKGRCLSGREIAIPKSWSGDLVHIVAHFMFDGRISSDGCIYYSKDRYQIIHMKCLLGKIFHVRPKIQLRDNNVYGVVFYHVEFAHFIKKCRDEIFGYLNNGSPVSCKRVFLQAFFDDEGNVFYAGDKKRVRGYQKSGIILQEIKNLLYNFGIDSKINKDGTNIEISGQHNLIRFAKAINFSAKIYLNPLRKNSIWKKKISKRKILSLLLDSYRNNKLFAH
ncbi:MAG: LAGLIDADG family homing endonuclease [Candidatus Omnitrophica bacterium]|nr:LAGLIDADG family homing endonuclease [Candidatus Omnitrophota bacterium]MBL7151320.1 LAGLIDADG family homing endonuclease [Candidatus Omnitrophota bacterium]